MRIWYICLAIWMGMYAVLALTNIDFKLRDVLMGILAAAVCISILFDRRFSGPYPPP